MKINLSMFSREMIQKIAKRIKTEREGGYQNALKRETHCCYCYLHVGDWEGVGVRQPIA